MSSNTIDATINAALAPVTEFVSSIIFFSVTVSGVELPIIVVWLVAAGLFHTLYFKFINLRGFRHALRVVRGDFSSPDDPGEVTHFQALTTALSATVGVGNISGVALAIGIGGPGATFWMIVAGFLGMSLKFVECHLAVKYRRVYKDGTVSGGPMHYFTHAFKKLGAPKIGAAFIAFFCVMCMGASFEVFQINQAYVQFSNVTGFEGGWIFGIVSACLVGLVIIGGIKSIARVTDKLVPLMCGIYVLTALFILFTHISQIPDAVRLIVVEAFNPSSVGGGFIGVLIVGFQRAVYSNEAGVGSAPIAHAAVRTSEPMTEGFVALLEPFIDTIIVCSITALVIVVTGAYKIEGLDGIEMTSAAFGGVVSWFPYLLAVAVILFAFSTVISWSYYGLRCWSYFFKHNVVAETGFKIMFCCLVAIGATLNPEQAIGIIESMLFAMALPNILALYILAPEVKRDLDIYWRRVNEGALGSSVESEVGLGNVVCAWKVSDPEKQNE